jgi:hypothetical protein
MMPKASNVYSQDYRIEFGATPSGSYVVRAFLAINILSLRDKLNFINALYIKKIKFYAYFPFGEGFRRGYLKAK